MQFKLIPKKHRRKAWQSIYVRFHRKSLWLNLWKMRRHFPHFTYEHTPTSVTWIGTLTPRKQSYTVRIHYNENEFPVVNVLQPQIPDDAPHIYRHNNNALCLFYPKVGECEWTCSDYVADTIVPWTALWLYYFEIWKITGTWFGKEAPHEPK